MVDKKHEKEVEVMSDSERVVGALFCWFKRCETGESSVWSHDKNNAELSIGLHELLRYETLFRGEKEDSMSHVDEEGQLGNSKEMEKSDGLMSNPENHELEVESVTESSRSVTAEKTESAFFPSHQLGTIL